MIFRLLKYYENQNLLIYLRHQNNSTYNIQYELFKIHYFPFYIIPFRLA